MHEPEEMYTVYYVMSLDDLALRRRGLRDTGETVTFRPAERGEAKGQFAPGPQCEGAPNVRVYILLYVLPNICRLHPLLVFYLRFLAVHSSC